MPKLSEVMAGQPAGQPGAPALGGTIRLSQLTGAPPAPAAAPYKATDDMGTMSRLLAGAGHGADALVEGIGQMGAHGLGALGLMDPKDVGYNDKAIHDDEALYQADLGKTTAGPVGSTIAQILATLPLSRMKLMQGPGAFRGAVNAGAQGGVIGALNPVYDVAQPKTTEDLMTGHEPEGENFLSGKLKQALFGAGAGAGLSGLASGVGSLAENLLPANAVKQVLNYYNGKANAAPFAQEGEALAAKTGVDLTPAQVSGSKAMSMAENAARQSVHSRDLAFEGDQRRVQQLSDYFEKLIGQHTVRDASSATAGAEIQGASQRLIKGLEDFRGKQAAQDFGEVRKLTANATDPIEFTGTADALKALHAEHGAVGTPASDKIAAFARKQLDNVSPKASGLTDADKQVMGQLGVKGFAPADLANVNPQALAMAEKASPGIGQRIQQEAIPSAAPAEGNLDKLMRLRSHLSKVAGGNASIGGDREDRMIARQLLGTIDQDIENSAGKVGGDLGGALKQANARYREASQQIDSVHAGPLGKILGKDVAGAFQSGDFNTVAPETVMERLGKLKPSEVSVVRGMLEKDQPQAWKTFRAHMLQDALEKAQAQAPSNGANTLALQPNVLVKSLADKKRLEAVFDPAELQAIQHGVDVARRLSDKTGYNFSGTAGQSEILNLLNNPLGGLKTMGNIGLGKVAQLATKGLGARQVAQVMNDADGRAALLQISRLPPGSAAAREASARVAAILATQNGGQPGEGKKPGE